MLIRHFFTQGLAIHSFLVIDEVSHKAVAIDPTRKIAPYLSAAEQEGFKITDIVETHVHADFMSGAVDLKAALGGAPAIHCSGMGGKAWTPVYADKVVTDREALSLGTVRLEAWHTPGHTPEHVIWVAYDETRSKNVPQAAFTGDLLFVGGVGRPDILGAEAEATLAKDLYRSLFKTLEPLPDSLEVFPSHGSGSLCGKGIGTGLFSTLGYERRCNPGMASKPYAEWLGTLHEEMPSVPSYFPRMKKLNVAGPAPSAGKETARFLSNEQIKPLLNDVTIIDVRRPDDFSLGSLPGAVNFPPSPMFSFWAAVTLSPESNILLLVEKSGDAAPFIEELKMVGLDRLAGVCALGQWTFEEKKGILQPMPAIGVERIRENPEGYYLLDVRNDKEWSGGHIDGAHHLELAKAVQSIGEIPIDRPIGVICHSGNRSSVLASLLAKRKGAKVFNVRGGMQEWQFAGYPVVTLS